MNVSDYPEKLARIIAMYRNMPGGSVSAPGPRFLGPGSGPSTQVQTTAEIDLGGIIRGIDYIRQLFGHLPDDKLHAMAAGIGKMATQMPYEKAVEELNKPATAALFRYLEEREIPSLMYGITKDEEGKFRPVELTQEAKEATLFGGPSAAELKAKREEPVYQASKAALSGSEEERKEALRRLKEFTLAQNPQLEMQSEVYKLQQDEIRQRMALNKEEYAFKREELNYNKQLALQQVKVAEKQLENALIEKAKILQTPVPRLPNDVVMALDNVHKQFTTGVTTIAAMPKYAGTKTLQLETDKVLQQLSLAQIAGPSAVTYTGDTTYAIPYTQFAFSAAKSLFNYADQTAKRPTLEERYGLQTVVNELYNLMSATRFATEDTVYDWVAMAYKAGLPSTAVDNALTQLNVPKEVKENVYRRFLRDIEEPTPKLPKQPKELPQEPEEKRLFTKEPPDIQPLVPGMYMP